MSKKDKDIKMCIEGQSRECTKECLHYVDETHCDYSATKFKYERRCAAGIDNGKSGFIVLTDPLTMQIVHIEPYPNPRRLYEVFAEFKPVYTIIEQVFMAPGFKSVASTNFEIMGRYKQVFDMLGLSYDCLRAVSWRSMLKIKAKGRQQQKAASIQTAQELFTPEDFELLKTNYHRRDKELHKIVEERWPDDNKCESALISYCAALRWKEQTK